MARTYIQEIKIYPARLETEKSVQLQDVQPTEISTTSAIVWSPQLYVITPTWGLPETKSMFFDGEILP